MPIEFSLLQNKPEPFKKCPKCAHEPFESFLRGQVQRRRFKYLFFKPWPYCCVICRKCKEIVGHEEP